MKMKHDQRFATSPRLQTIHCLFVIASDSLDIQWLVAQLEVSACHGESECHADTQQNTGNRHDDLTAMIDRASSRLLDWSLLHTASIGTSRSLRSAACTYGAGHGHSPGPPAGPGPRSKAGEGHAGRRRHCPAREALALRPDGHWVRFDGPLSRLSGGPGPQPSKSAAEVNRT